MARCLVEKGIGERIIIPWKAGWPNGSGYYSQDRQQLTAGKALIFRHQMLYSLNTCVLTNTMRTGATAAATRESRVKKPGDRYKPNYVKNIGFLTDHVPCILSKTCSRKFSSNSTLASPHPYICSITNRWMDRKQSWISFIYILTFFVLGLLQQVIRQEYCTHIFCPSQWAIVNDITQSSAIWVWYKHKQPHWDWGSNRSIFNKKQLPTVSFTIFFPVHFDAWFPYMVVFFFTLRDSV